MAFENNHYYHSSIRRLTAAIGSLLKNMRIVRLNPDASIHSTIIVPLSYASGDRAITMIQQQKEQRIREDVEVRIALPRITFSLTGMTYDSPRQSQPVINTIYNNTVSGIATTQFKPIPYDFEYTVNLWVKNMDDGLQIIEQIAPYFRPFYTVTLEDIPSLNIIRDVPVALTSISQEDIYEGIVEDERIINWTITLLAKGWLYPPISSSNVIKTAYTNLLDLDNEERIFGSILTIDPANAEKDDEYEVIETIEDGPPV
jgi:hypothetical protein